MSKIEQIKSLYKTLRDSVRNHRVFVPEEVYLERFTICLNCPKHVESTLSIPCFTCPGKAPKPGNKVYRCLECGCFIREKASLTGSECPLGKWGKYSDEPKENQLETPQRFSK